DIESERGLPLTGLAAVDERETILDLETAEVGGHWLLVEDFHIEEAVLVGLDVARAAAGEDRPGLWTRDAQRLGDGAVVDDLEQHRRVAALLQLDRGRPAGRLDARLRVEADHDEDVRVEQFLELFGIAVLRGFLERRGLFLAERGAQEVEGLEQPGDV